MTLRNFSYLCMAATWVALYFGYPGVSFIISLTCAVGWAVVFFDKHLTSDYLRRSRNMDFAPTTDRHGKPLTPGDRVSFRMFPKGHASGVVAISDRVQERLEDGTYAPALVIQAHGTTYSLISKGVTKLV